jgi:hypothetical protein
MALYFSESQVRSNDFVGPDVFVVTQTTKRTRKSWVMWQEARGPDIVIELTSPLTEHRDRGDKMQIYANALRVPEYFVYDPAHGRLDAWRLSGGEYRPVLPRAPGFFPSTRLPIGLAVATRELNGEEVPWLRWTDATGALLPLPEERASAAEAQARVDAERAEAEKQRAEAEKQRAEAEKQRAERLAARLRALGIDPEAD